MDRQSAVMTTRRLRDLLAADPVLAELRKLSKKPKGN
jgi:hypothetical protein